MAYREIVIDEELFYELMRIGQVLEKHGDADGSFTDTIKFLIQNLERR